MFPETRNPSGKAGASKAVILLPGVNDCFENTPNLIDLQAARIRRQYRLGEALAVAVAELAFATRGRFA